MIAELRDIPGHPGYRASADGSIWSSWGKGRRSPSGEWLRLKPRAGSHGYLSLRLAGSGTHCVHTLILLAFVGPRPDGHEARHLDGNPLNNRAENLLWGTPAENMADQRRHGTRVHGDSHPQAKLTDADVAEIRRLSETVSQRKLAAMLGISRSTVVRVLRGTHRKLREVV